MDFNDNGSGHVPKMGILPLLLISSGTLLIFFSMLQITRIVGGPFPFLEKLNVRPDLIAGAILFLEGLLFIIGGTKLIKGRSEGIAFAWVGWMTGVLLSTVSALILLSNTFSSLLLSLEDMEDWTAMTDVVPSLYLGLILIILLPVLARLGRKTVEQGPRRFRE